MKKAALAAATFAILIAPVVLFAWGDAGHRMIGLAAAQAMPAQTPAFFRAASQQLSYLNFEPDRWKNQAETRLDGALNGGTSPEHYMNMDAVSPAVLRAALAAPNRFAFADTLRAANINPRSMGLLPFEMLELAQRLRNDFRLWRIAPDSTVRAWTEARIIEDAGLLGHYVADGANPHHTTKHPNGWVGDNPKGYTTDNTFHSRFESQFVQGQIKVSDFSGLVAREPRVFPNLREAIVSYLMSSLDLVDDLYELEKKAPFRAETATPEQKAFAAARLAAGATMLRDIWWTAWVTSADSPAGDR